MNEINSKDSNIAIITAGLNGGGMERVARSLSQHLNESYNVFVLSLSNDDSNGFGGTVITIGVSGIYNDIRYYKEKYSIDCAISFGATMNIANIRTKGNELVIVTHHNSTGFLTDEIPFVKIYYPFADVVVACSHGVAELIRHHVNVEEDRVVGIYNYFEKSLNRDIRLTFFPPDVEMFLQDSKYAMCAGRFTPEKNLISLVRQFVYYHDKYDDKLKLLIIGAGAFGNKSYEDKVVSEIVRFEAEKYIKCIPFCNPEIYYQNATVFLLTSISEGLGNVILEAMSYGIPVVSTDCFCGPRELLNDEVDYTKNTIDYRVAKRGILVENDKYDNGISTHHFADAMNKLLTDKDLENRIIEKERDFIDQYSDRDITEQWKTLITSYNRIDSGINCMEKAYDDAFRNSNVLIIYGAGAYGRKALKPHDDGKHTIFFAITGDSDEKIEGYDVKNIEELVNYKDEAMVLIATMYEHYYTEMLNNARRLGFVKIFYPRM